MASLRESGLSLRAIASATGAAYNTILKDVTQTASPAEITGSDGKTYPAARPADPYSWIEPDADEIPGQSHVLEHAALETVTPTVTRRRPLPEAFADAGRDLNRATTRHHRAHCCSRCEQPPAAAP